MRNTTKVLMAASLAVGTLAGCQTTPSVTAPTTQIITAEALQANDWQLVDAKLANGSQVAPLFYDPAKPLVLSFNNYDGDNRVAFKNTCNNMSAQYRVVNGAVQIENGIGTLMACPEPQANFDAATLTTVQGNYSLNKNASNAPVLTIRNDSQIAYFKAIAK